MLPVPECFLSGGSIIIDEMKAEKAGYGHCPDKYIIGFCDRLAPSVQGGFLLL